MNIENIMAYVIFPSQHNLLRRLRRALASKKSNQIIRKKVYVTIQITFQLGVGVASIFVCKQFMI